MKHADSHVPTLSGGGVRVGYVRVSTVAQTLDQQETALATAGVIKTFSDTMSGAKDDRPGLPLFSTTFATATPSWCGSSTA